jgi:hypothetical protein
MLGDDFECGGIPSIYHDPSAEFKKYERVSGELQSYQPLRARRFTK